jgi:hypothetical protein
LIGCAGETISLLLEKPLRLNDADLATFPENNQNAERKATGNSAVPDEAQL